MNRTCCLAITIIVALALCAFVFPSSFAQDKMPMGGQPAAASRKAVAGKTKNRAVNGQKMPMGQSGSLHPRTMSGGTQTMPVPMGQSGSQQPGSMIGMQTAGQTGSSGQNTGNQAAADSSEHAKHHPAGAPPNAASGASMGPMMNGMGAMMAPEPVANPNTTAVLPIPPNSLNDQLRIEQLANTRIDDGTALMTQGIVSLSQAKQRNDLTAMSQATAQVRNGLFQVESGLSAHRALAEGIPPRDVSLTWFKQQMNLAPTEQVQDIFGVSWFHFFVMVALSIFAVAMILMYFFKMRRAAEVLSRVTTTESAPSAPIVDSPGVPGGTIQVSKAPASEAQLPESDATTTGPSTES